ncbi:MAG TPA: PKD domain-containing protein [Bacteroidia bacterium]|jgi:PKD repeat protein|nr:PKD domain-containing protein [Bacteroidia bacterium]
MKKITIAILLSVLTTSAFAQLAMTRSTYTAAYTPISLPAATLSTATGDDVAQSAIPIGFTFTYLGTPYTTIGLSTNGVASFSPLMSTSGTNNNLFTGTAPNLSLAPWWDNLWSDTVLYQLQGVPGSQTFTIQWTDAYSYFNTALQQLNFQIILHEGTNVIEFAYGNLVPGVTAANESASIGIEGATGGPGNYLDAVTGSAFTSNGMLNALNEWPSHNFRFTPGAPTAIAAGTYTVGNAGNYFNLSEAIADVNHRGIAGPVVLSLIDVNYDVTPANGDNFFPMLVGPVAGTSSTNTLSIMPASGTSTITSEGTLNGNCGNAAANNVISNTNEPILSFVGVNNVSAMNLTLTCSATGVVDRGLQVINSSATIGSQNNTFQNISVTLNRGNVGCYGISQQAITNPTAATGANSNNTYTDLNISNVYTGIYLNGNANFPDLNCVVGSSSPTTFNMIGGATANDIGNGTGGTATYGIRANNQSGVSIYNNEVRNLSHGGTSFVEGIAIDAGQGNINIYMNKVHDISNTSTGFGGDVTGIRVNLANSGTHTANVYNNFIWGITDTWTGAATASRAIRGINIQNNALGVATETINVDFNNVRIDNSGAPNMSSTCIDIGTVGGPVINIRDNVFANFTGTQAGAAMHFAMATPNTTAVGNTGSVSDYNDLFVNNATNGNVGIGATTAYATLANWQTAMSQDANSVSVDPGFSSATDLHVSAVQLNNTGNATSTPWVTVDIDNQSRSVTPDIGADEFTPLLLDAGVTALVAPINSGCHSSTEQVTVALKNFASVPLDFSTDNVTVTVNITGALTQTLTFTISDNSLNGNLPLASGTSMNVPVGMINMTAQGTYMFNSYSTLSGDGNAVNDAMSQVNIDYMPGSATASPTSVCAGSPVNLSLSGSSAGGTIQWMSSTDNGVTWNNETGPGNTTANYSTTPSANTLYQVAFCGTMLTNADTVMYYPITSPTVVDDTVCGPGVVNLSATGSGTIYWYANAVGGTALASGAGYSPNVAASTTFYVSNTTGSINAEVGLYDNSAGGAMSASANNLIFDVLSNCTLSGVYVYPAAAGNVVIDLEDNTNAVINTVTVAVSAADIGQRTYIPLGFNLTPATGMQLVRNFASVNCWRNNIGVNYPYTVTGIISITGSTAGAGFYYFFYDWQINYGCESSRVPLNVVVTTPVAISATAVDTMLCVGGNTSISVSSSDLNYNYTWGPAATLNTTTGSTVIATPATTTTYTVDALDNGTGCRASDSVMITVNSLPSSMVNAADTVICSGTADTLTVCSQQSVGLFDNSAGGNMSASVNNLIFDVLSNTTLFGVYVYPATAGTVTIDLEDNTNAVINSVTATINASDINQRTYIPLNFQLTPATGMQLVRNASSVNLWRNNVGVTYPYTLPGVLSITSSTAGAGFYYFFYDWQVCAPGGPYSFAWTSNPVGFTATGDSAFVAPTVSTQYFCTVTDTVTGCSSVFSTTINMPSAIVANVTGTNSICAGDSALLIAGFTGGDGSATYAWSSSASTNDSIWVMPASTATYTLTATDGCGSVSTATFTVVVNTGAPIASFTSQATGVNMFTFTDASTNATSWSWDFGDSQTSTLQNPSHTYATTGSYTVTLIVTNGCGTDTITQVITADGLEHLSLQNSVSVYPNPAKGHFNVQFNGTTDAIFTLQLFDLAGKLMMEKEVNAKAGTVVPVNVERYATGLYMLKLTSENSTAVFKVDVQ